MFRHITIGKITLILTLFLVIINTGIHLILDALGVTPGSSFKSIIILLIVSVVLIYLVVRSFLEKFVLSKIRLIYKLIGESNQVKSADAHQNLEDISITDVNNEVIEWAQRRQSEIEDLTKLENYRRNYLGNISHELKTPLFSIQGYIHTLLDGGVHDENINIKYLNRAASNLERLQKIVDDLEMINHLESGKISLQKETFDIKELTNEVIDDMLFMAKESNVKLSLHETAQPSFKVSADRENIRQLLSNLIANGIKYGKKKGHVIIGFYDMDDKVLIEIEDDGIGIAPEHINHLFDRFYRVDESRSRKRGGSGLGLSIVKHILEAHHQSITVKSTEGVGTTFRFTLDKG